MPRIINAFIFFDEIDLLEIRLHELDPVVDLFVIVETLCHNASNAKKPQCLSMKNWDNVVRPFAHKVEYSVISHLEPRYDSNSPSEGWKSNLSAWEREKNQRNMIMPAVIAAGAHPDDVLILTEGDEIPRAATLQAHRDILHTGIHQLQMDFFYYNVNRLVTEPWAISHAGTVKQIQDAGGLAAVHATVGGRGNGEGGKYPWIRDCGWHFSTFGTLEHIKQKFSGFAHAADPVVKEFFARNDEREMIRRIAAGEYLTNDRANWTVWRDTDSRLPRHFLNNQDKFRAMTDAHFRVQHADALGGL